MTNNQDDHDGLIDDDPALDCILFEEMRRDSNQPNRGGCLGLLLILMTSALPFPLLLAIA